MEFEVTNQCSDYNLVRPMAAKAADALGMPGLTIVADAGYDSAGDIVASMRDGFDVHVAGTDFDACVPAKAGEPTEAITSHRDGRCEAGGGMCGEISLDASAAGPARLDFVGVLRIVSLCRPSA